MQYAGGVLQASGTVAAIAGTPVAGVGAAPGLAIAGTGSVMKLIGDGIEVFTEAVAGDSKTAKEKTAEVIVDKLVDKGVDAVLPGPTPEMAKQFREAVNDAKEVTKNAVETGKTIIEKQKNR